MSMSRGLIFDFVSGKASTGPDSILSSQRLVSQAFDLGSTVSFRHIDGIFH